jgi:hypothetical protein
VAAIVPPPPNERASGAHRGLHAVRQWRLINDLGGGQLVSVDHFRHELLMQLRDAADQGGTTIVITSGELCKNIRMGSSSTQACCEAMLAEVKPGDVVLVSSSGAETIIRYRLPRTAQ